MPPITAPTINPTWFAFPDVTWVAKPGVGSGMTEVMSKTVVNFSPFERVPTEVVGIPVVINGTLDFPPALPVKLTDPDFDPETFPDPEFDADLVDAGGSDAGGGGGDVAG